MVGVNDDCRIFQVTVIVHFQKKLQILVVIVGQGIAVFVHSTAQDGVGEGIALCLDFPSSGDEVMSCCAAPRS